MDRKMKEALDRHITGNGGEDSVDVLKEVMDGDEWVTIKISQKYAKEIDRIWQLGKLRASSLPRTYVIECALAIGLDGLDACFKRMDPDDWIEIEKEAQELLKKAIYR